MENTDLNPQSQATAPVNSTPPPVQASPTAQPIPTEPPKKSNKRLIILIVILLLLALGAGAYYFLGNKLPFGNNQTACTLEAMICPDGSSVGRTGPNCEFSPCPTTNNSKQKTENDETSDWKTYTNTKYKYSFKYPSPYSALRGAAHLKTEGNEHSVIITIKDSQGPTYPIFYVNSYPLEGEYPYDGDMYNEDSFSSNVDSYLKIEIGSSVKPPNQSWNAEFVRKEDIQVNNIKSWVFESSTVKPIDRKVIIKKGNNTFILGTFYSNEKELNRFNQILSTFKFTDQASESSTVPSDWTLKSDTACNVVFSIPPKKTPYYTPDDANTFSDLAEDGAFWQFQENNEGSSLFAYYKRVLFHNPKAGGSGYIPGLVSVSCSANENKYTNDILLERYKKTFEGGASSGIEVSEIKELNLWGRKVYAVYVKGGMFDENNPTYLFATDKHIYSVSKIAMSSNPFVKETAETIFNNLNFKD